MSKDDDIVEGAAGVPAPDEGKNAASETPAARMKARHTPSSSVNRRFDRETAAQVEEWHLRQESRAVPASYRKNAQGTHEQPLGTVYTPDPDVLDAQNAIPAQGRPVRTRPSIPNYQPRVNPDADVLDAQNAIPAQGRPTRSRKPLSDIPEISASPAEEQPVLDAEIVEGELVDAPTAPKKPRQTPVRHEPPTHYEVPAAGAGEGMRNAIGDASNTLRDGAAKVGQAGAAFAGNVKESEAAAKAKDFARKVPGYLAAAGRRVYRTETGAWRKQSLIVTAILILYVAVAIFFSCHYYPFTNIGPVSVGNMDVAEAEQAIGKAVNGYQLKVSSEDDSVSFTVKSSDVGFSLDAHDIAQEAMDADSGWLWPLYLILPHDHTDAMVTSTDSDGFRQVISDAVTWYNQDATEPKDATLSYDKSSKTFSIVAEERGNMLDEEAITADVIEAISQMNTELTLDDDDYLKPTVYKDDSRLAAALAEAEKILATDLTLTAHDSEAATLKGSDAAEWVSTDEDVQITLDEEQLYEWIATVAEKCNTVGGTRKWTREDGEEFTVVGGTYGWEIDEYGLAATVIDSITAGSAQRIEIPMAQEADAYDGQNGRDWDAYIDVDIDAQHATYYDENGKVIWQADFVSGEDDDEHNTPEGVYYVNGKASPSTLVGATNATGSAEYRTTVQYWMPWVNNSVGFHDATWQDSFGGDRYQEGYGSHGCINLSLEDAESLYELVDAGTVVVCHSTEGKGQKTAKAELEGTAE